MQTKSQWNAKYIWREPTLEETGNKVSDVHARVYARNTSAWIHLNSIGTVMLKKLTFSNKPFHEGFQPDYILFSQYWYYTHTAKLWSGGSWDSIMMRTANSRQQSAIQASPLFLDFRGISAREALPWTLCVWSWGDRCLWQLEHSQAEEWMVWQHFADEVANGSNSWSWVTS